MSNEDRKNKVIRSERVKDFERSMKMETITARMMRIENMQKDKYLLEEERRKIENEINSKKDVMLLRLGKVLKNDKILSKSEILDYVINDIKPRKKNKEGDNTK